jgi:enamine deaminase RidA (YjgF/YER057c/UK114 family)
MRARQSRFESAVKIKASGFLLDIARCAVQICGYEQNNVKSGIRKLPVASSDHCRNRRSIAYVEDPIMRILQPADWSKPRGFSHGIAVDGPGRWVVLAGQTGGDEKGDYQPDMAGQVGVALRRIMKLLAEAGAGPEHIVRLTWYLTSRSEYEAAGAGIGAAWRETLGRNFPPSTLLYIDGLVDARAKVEIEVTAFVPSA